MSAVSLDDIRSREQAATEGPWVSFPGYGASGEGVTAVFQEEATGWIAACEPDQQGEWDGQFIAHARTDIPFLLDERDKLRAALDAVLALAEEWRYKGEFGWGAWQEGHAPDMEGHVLDDASADLRKKITEALR